MDLEEIKKKYEGECGTYVGCDKGMSMPPITPKFIHNKNRFKNITEAIKMYMDTGKKIPLEWIVEYNDLTYIIKEEKK